MQCSLCEKTRVRAIVVEIKRLCLLGACLELALIIRGGVVVRHFAITAETFVWAPTRSANISGNTNGVEGDTNRTLTRRRNA